MIMKPEIEQKILRGSVRAALARRRYKKAMKSRVSPAFRGRPFVYRGLARKLMEAGVLVPC